MEAETKQAKRQGQSFGFGGYFGYNDDDNDRPQGILKVSGGGQREGKEEDEASNGEDDERKTLSGLAVDLRKDHGTKLPEGCVT